MRNIALVVASLVFIAFLATSLIIIFSSKPPAPTIVERTSLEDAILEDARERFEGADIIDIVNVEEKDGAKYVVVRVTYNYSSACPVRKHVYYTYPEGLFLPEYPVNVITDCNLCSGGDCLVIYEEQAIAASLNIPGTEEVRKMVEIEGATPVPRKRGNVWAVSWVGESRTYEVIFTNKGDLIDVILKNPSDQ